MTVQRQDIMDNSKKTGIVLNRMYAGDYLSTNLGHEVINMFQADNGNHYIYLNATGNFARIHSGKIGYMLLVKYHAEGIFEVIGKAEGLTDIYEENATLKQDHKAVDPTISEAQNDYIERENITYGGVPIRKIFSDAEQQNIFVTYKAEKLYKPTKPIFISYGDNGGINCEEECVKIYLKGYNQALTPLKTYMYPEGTFKGDQKRENIEEKKDDYNNVLNNLINNKKLWTTKGIEKVNVKNTKIQQSVSIFDICQIQNDENAFSNALAHFIMQEKYRKLWKKFFAKRDIVLGEDYTVAREESAKIEDKNWDNDNEPGGGRIDLLIKDNKNIIVIENKIKSDINTKKSDKGGITQLNRYVNYVKWLIKHSKGEKPTPHFVILTPKYNMPEIGEDMKNVYSIVTYYDLYYFLQKNMADFEDDSNFVDFYNAMFRHTHENVNDYLYYDMMEKFVMRINEATK